MKRSLKFLLVSAIAILVCSAFTFVYADEEDGRFVDIPVPPADTGMADFTEQEAENQAKQYENNNTEINDDGVTFKDKTYNTAKNENIQNENADNNVLNEEENIEQNEGNDNITENVSTVPNTINPSNEDNVRRKKQCATIIILIIAIIIVILVMIYGVQHLNKESKGKRSK